MIYYFKCKMTYKINEIINKFLLVSDKFMPEMHLRQPGFTYSACGSITKIKERVQKFKETGYTSYIYKNELDKACFHYDMAYGDFKGLAKRTIADKVLRDKAFKIASNQNMMDIREDWLQWYINFLIKSHKEMGLLIIGKYTISK